MKKLLLTAVVSIAIFGLGGFALAGIEITTPLYIVTDLNGTPITGLTKSTTPLNAMAKASNLPTGSYKIVHEDITITVMNNAPVVEPPIIIIEPPVVVDPPIEPEPPVIINSVSTGVTLQDCLDSLEIWCELGASNGLWSVANPDSPIGSPLQTTNAWGGAAYDKVNHVMYFTGGGHGDSADNTVYSFDIKQGQWERLTNYSPLTHLVKRHENLAVEGQYTKVPDLTKEPGAAHSYDGLSFNQDTKTIFYFSMRPAGKYLASGVADDDSRVLDASFGRSSQYEFNPSATEVRNGLQPRTWRLVGKLSTTYPKTAMANGKIYLGYHWGVDEIVFDGTQMSSAKRFIRYASWGDGSMKYDPIRDVMWIIHDGGKVLFGYGMDGVARYSSMVKVGGKSIAFDSDNNLVIWDGRGKIGVYNPDLDEWKITEYAHVRNAIYGQVFSKWVSVSPDVFVGLSNSNTGLWVYKKPKTVFSEVNTPTTIKKLDSIPFDDVAALQEAKLIPNFGIATHKVNARSSLSWDGSGGDGDHIGIYTEQQAAYIAGQVDLKESILANALVGTPNNREFTHQPNAFWLPYLLTGNQFFVDEMEKGWSMYNGYRNKSHSYPIVSNQQRGGAWNLRDLVQLAWLEKQGLTTKSGYILALNNTRDRYLAITRGDLGDESNQRFNILDFNSEGTNVVSFNGWMGAMMGQAVAYTAWLTDDPLWLEINAWHFGQLLKTSGDIWPLKALGYSHVFFRDYAENDSLESIKLAKKTLDLNTIVAYRGIADTYHNLPDNKVVDAEFRATPESFRHTFKNRVERCYGWAMLSCLNAVDRACDKADELRVGITDANYAWDYKNGVVQ